MKTKQILTAGAIALSMILTGCSSTSTDTKDTKTTEVAKKKEVQEKRSKNNWSKKQGFKIFEDDKQHRKEDHCI